MRALRWWKPIGLPHRQKRSSRYPESSRSHHQRIGQWSRPPELELSMGWISQAAYYPWAHNYSRRAKFDRQHELHCYCQFRGLIISTPLQRIKEELDLCCRMSNCWEKTSESPHLHCLLQLEQNMADCFLIFIAIWASQRDIHPMVP